MKRFSIWAFVPTALVHIIVSAYLVNGAVIASYAEEHGQPDYSSVWTAALWTWDTIPMLLAPFAQPLRPAHFLYLVLPWSLFIGACFGFLVPALSRWRRRSSN